MTDDPFAEQTETHTVQEVAPQYGVGPVTIRELALLVVWAAAFVVSFFPLMTNAVNPAIGGGTSVWTGGLDWILTIGVPTVAVFLIVLRRFSPQGIRRVGSLGIDQFASVAFSVSAAVWLVMLWHTVSVMITADAWVRTWVVWVEFFVMLAGVVLTVAAPIIPPFAQDFQGRPDAPAHRSARPVRALTARPPRPRPAPETATAPEPERLATSAPDVEPAPVFAAEPTPTPARQDSGPIAAVSSATGAYQALGFDRPSDAPAEDLAEPVAEVAPAAESAYEPAEPALAYEPAPAYEPEPQPAVVPQAFWALAPVERDVHDERGMPIFRIGPTAWALVIEDRGSLFVIRHEDGRIGYLHDVTGVTRG